MEKTLGEKRVRIDFNTTNNSLVDEIKNKSAELINLVNKFQYEKNNSIYSTLEQQTEFKRIKDLAMTSYEEAAMWAVKVITYKQE